MFLAGVNHCRDTEELPEPLIVFITIPETRSARARSRKLRGRENRFRISPTYFTVPRVSGAVVPVVRSI